MTPGAPSVSRRVRWPPSGGYGPDMAGSGQSGAPAAAPLQPYPGQCRARWLSHRRGISRRRSSLIHAQGYQQQRTTAALSRNRTDTSQHAMAACRRRRAMRRRTRPMSPAAREPAANARRATATAGTRQRAAQRAEAVRGALSRSTRSLITRQAAVSAAAATANSLTRSNSKYAQQQPYHAPQQPYMPQQQPYPNQGYYAQQQPYIPQPPAGYAQPYYPQQPQGARPAATRRRRQQRRHSASPKNSRRSIASRRAPCRAGIVFRNRNGEDGLSNLTDIEAPIQGRIKAGNGHIVVTATPVTLDAGTAAADTSDAGALRLGLSDARALDGRLEQQYGSQTASGVGLSVGYENRSVKRRRRRDAARLSREEHRGWRAIQRRHDRQGLVFARRRAPRRDGQLALLCRCARSGSRASNGAA